MHLASDGMPISFNGKAHHHHHHLLEIMCFMILFLLVCIEALANMLFSLGRDVFLSHSGKQKNFVRDLHRDLITQHVSCFFDEDRKSLPLAHKFPPRIFKAAETCKLAVVVLSKDFVRSKWPMIELSAFITSMKSGTNAKLLLLPIFFMISPEELSHITKDSSEWQKLEESGETRVKWQDALKEVRSIKGLYFGEDDNELEFRDKVVKEICCLLKGIDPDFPIQGEAPQNQNQSQSEVTPRHSPSSNHFLDIQGNGKFFNLSFSFKFFMGSS